MGLNQQWFIPPEGMMIGARRLALRPAFFFFGFFAFFAIVVCLSRKWVAGTLPAVSPYSARYP